LIALALCSVVFQFITAYLSFRFVRLRRLGKPWIIVSATFLFVGGIRVYTIGAYYEEIFLASPDSTIHLIEFACSFLLGVGFILTERWYLLKERLEGRFRLIADVDRALIGVLDEEKILSAVCDGLVQERGYRLVWIGTAEPDGSVSVGKFAGEGQEFLEKVWIRWDDTDEGGCPPGVAARTGEVCVVDRVLDDPRTRFWRRAAEKYGVRSFASVRIEIKNANPMVLSIGGGREGIFDRLEVEAIEAMASRVGNALVSARKHELFVSAKQSYGELFQFQRDGVILVRGGAIVRVNPAGARMLGYSSAEDLLGMDPAQLIPESEDDQRLFQLRRPVTEERESVVIAKMRRKDGSLFEGEITATWVARKGRTESWEKVMTGPLGMLIFRDVTLRAQTLEELRKERDFSAKVLDVADMLVLQIRPEGEIILFNRQCEEVTGYTAAQAIGRQMTDMLLPESVRDVHRRGVGEILSGQIPSEREYALLTKSGEERMVIWNYEAIPGPDGASTSILMAGTDVTERRRLERAIIGMQKMEAVGTLAGGVAHDFNNILTGILGNLDLTRKSLPPGSAAAATIEESIHASERAARLIQQLLEFSRRTTLERQATDMRKVAGDAVHLFSQTIDKRIGVVVSAEDDLWLAKVDPGQVHQVLMNLCVNARDAILEKLEGGQACSGEAEIRVRAGNATIGEEYCRNYPFARTGEYVVLSIADNGVGMDETTQRRVFEPFFTTKSLGRGTGLGLSTVYGIVKQHEGWITLDSAPGTGTTFRCYFPRSTDLPKEVADVPATKSPLGGKETILLVDDEEMILDLGKQILTVRGYHVLTARDGREAIDMFRKGKGAIDLVLLDLTMPHMSGLDVLERIRKIDPEVKVVLSSGYRAEDSHSRERFSEASAFLCKPYRADVLAGIVRDVLDGVSA
jgi:two-component system cell cycle sensor histidine kinase/response regulator CckA